MTCDRPAVSIDHTLSGASSPALHLHHEGLFDGDPAAVDDHALGVRQVPVVGVLQLDGVNHRLTGRRTEGRSGTIHSTHTNTNWLHVRDLVRGPEPTIPSRTLPKTTCFPSSHGALVARMKNCDPLVSGPALAILTWYR